MRELPPNKVSPDTVVVWRLNPVDEMVLDAEMFMTIFPTYDAAKFTAVAVAVPDDERTALEVAVIVSPIHDAAAIWRFLLLADATPANI